MYILFYCPNTDPNYDLYDVYLTNPIVLYILALFTMFVCAVILHILLKIMSIHAIYLYLFLLHRLIVVDLVLDYYDYCSLLFFMISLYLVTVCSIYLLFILNHACRYFSLFYFRLSYFKQLYQHFWHFICFRLWFVFINHIYCV